MKIPDKLFRYRPLDDVLLDRELGALRDAYGDRPYYLNLSALPDTGLRAQAVLSTKNLKWSYEREWRLFSPSPGEGQHGDGAVATVYLGMRMAQEDRGLITRRLRAVGVRVRRTLVDGYSVKCFRPHPSS